MNIDQIKQVDNALNKLKVLGDEFVSSFHFPLLVVLVMF
jgi:hypothetical protein